VPYELVWPQDTLNEVDEFVADNFKTRETQDAAVDAIEQEFGRLAVNPWYGRVEAVTQTWTRRAYRYILVLGNGEGGSARVSYSERPIPPQVVTYGFEQAYQTEGPPDWL
jgi:hypothetical protein